MDDPLYGADGRGDARRALPHGALSSGLLRDEQTDQTGAAAGPGAAVPRTGLLRGCRVHDASARRVRPAGDRAGCRLSLHVQCDVDHQEPSDPQKTAGQVRGTPAFRSLRRPDRAAPGSEVPLRDPPPVRVVRRDAPQTEGVRWRAYMAAFRFHSDLAQSLPLGPPGAGLDPGHLPPPDTFPAAGRISRRRLFSHFLTSSGRWGGSSSVPVIAGIGRDPFGSGSSFRHGRPAKWPG